MMLTYLANSGFALENGEQLLVFDCYNPHKHPMLKVDALAKYQSVIVFISHAHGDHFSPAIWKIPNAAFVASFDVPLAGAPEGRVYVLRPGERTTVNGLSVAAYGSTDEGVSFHVHWEEFHLFHAGDLNDWHWQDESDEEYSKQEERKFLNELNQIKQGVPAPDLAFFPVDPRMGTDYYRGAVLFAEAMRPKALMPMHFGRTYAPPEAFVKEISVYTRLLTPPAMGESIVIPYGEGRRLPSSP